MYTTQFWSVLRDRLEEKIAATERFLGQGGASDFTQYQRKVGQIEGMKACIDQAKDILGDEGRGRTRQPEPDDD